MTDFKLFIFLPRPSHCTYRCVSSTVFIGFFHLSRGGRVLQGAYCGIQLHDALTTARPIRQYVVPIAQAKVSGRHGAGFD